MSLSRALRKFAHRIALEDERRGLGVEIDARRIGDPAEHRRLIERERQVIREISAILARIRAEPVQGIDDIAVLLDLAFDIELDALSPDLIMQDRPWPLLLVRGLRSLAPGGRNVLATSAIARRFRPRGGAFRGCWNGQSRGCADIAASPPERGSAADGGR